MAPKRRSSRAKAQCPPPDVQGPEASPAAGEASAQAAVQQGAPAACIQAPSQPARQDNKPASTDGTEEQPTAPAANMAPTGAPAAPCEAAAPVDEPSAAPEEPSEATTEADDEALAGWLAPEALEEEKELRKQHAEEDELEGKAREDMARGVGGAAPALVTSELSSKRFHQLDFLLQQSGLYVEFMTEQMQQIDDRLTEESQAAMDAAETAAHAKQQQEEAAAVDAAAAGGGRKKRKRAQEPVPDAKRAKTGPTLTHTQALLPGFNIELRDYQLKGVKWLISLYQNGVNGILADQMGLGKTAQTIAMLYHLHRRGLRGPWLVVAPLSTLTNWMAEFASFAPTMPTLMYHGTIAERAVMAERLKKVGTPDYPVIITSYEILIADSTTLGNLKIKYLVVDEGQRLKNCQGRLVRELKGLNAEQRLLLSGTPLQNNLAELWSLLNFLMPDVFRDLRNFEDWFQFSALVGQEGSNAAIVAEQQRHQVISKLHSILRPFMLRRLKSDVDIEVPRKQEMVLYAPMTEEQRRINQHIREGTLMEEMRKLAEQEGVNANSQLGKLHNMLMQMRKNCNHPDLITAPFKFDMGFPQPDMLVAECGKMQLLDRLLRKLRAQGHKVLVFSQMVTMLDVIDAYASQLGHKVCRLDGSYSMEQRQENIKAFNSDPDAWLFLLSTRAGGLGINLTAADTVIIYDSDWNPQQDLQAMDRCHRIGQTKPVLVFRLATAHSVEGRMLHCAASKMALERLVIQKGGFQNTPAESAAASKGGKGFTLSEAEMKQLLAADYKMDDLPQSGTITDEMLDKLLDRRHLLAKVGDAAMVPLPYPVSDVGYEVVVTRNPSGSGEGDEDGGLEHINN